MATRLVVEWTRSSLRLAVAEGGGVRWRLRAIQTHATGEITEALRGVFKTNKTAPTQVIAVISREHVITRVVKFPSTDRVEVAQMAQLYAQAQLPYPKEQTVMDYYTLSQADGFSTVAIVACQRDVIDRQLAVLRTAGLSVGLLTVSSWGVVGWYRQLVTANTHTIKEPTLIINVDDTRTDLVLMGQGRMLASRSIGQGMQDWQSMPDSAELVLLEVERSRAAIRKELPGTEVASVLLTGIRQVDAWSGLLSTRLGLPVVTVDPSGPLNISMLRAQMPISPVVIGGLARADLRDVLDLSPQEVRQQVQHRRQVQDLVAISALAVGVLVLSGAGLGLQALRQRRVAGQLSAILQDVEPVASAIKERKQLIKHVEALLGQRRALAASMAGVFHSTSSVISLEWIAFEHARRELTLKGHADSTPLVFEYMTRLRQTQGIADVQLKYTTRRSTLTGERTDFELLLIQQDSEATS